jgi:hypothetical protein
MAQTFACKFHYSSQWYDQDDDNYNPTSHDGEFTVTAETLEEAIEKAETEVARRNRSCYAGPDPQMPITYPNTFLTQVGGCNGKSFAKNYFPRAAAIELQNTQK